MSPADLREMAGRVRRDEPGDLELPHDEANRLASALEWAARDIDAAARALSEGAWREGVPLLTIAKMCAVDAVRVQAVAVRQGERLQAIYRALGVEEDIDMGRDPIEAAKSVADGKREFSDWALRAESDRDAALARVKELEEGASTTSRVWMLTAKQLRDDLDTARAEAEKMRPVYERAVRLRAMWDRPCAVKDGVSFSDEVEASRDLIAAIDTATKGPTP